MLNLLTLVTMQFSDNILIIATRVSGKRVFGTPKSWWFYTLENGLKEDSKTFKANKQKHRG